MKGGSEPRLLTPDLPDPRDPVDPRMNQFSCISLAYIGKDEKDVALALCFFDFFRTASRESYSFETKFRRFGSGRPGGLYGALGQFWEALAELREAFGELCTKACGQRHMVKGMWPHAFDHMPLTTSL